MSLLELLDNIFQLIITCSVGILACISAIRHPKFIPLQYLAGAAFCWFIGTIYWTIYFVIYGDFPYYFSASELCYLGVYLFFIGVSINIYRDNPGIPLDKSKKLQCLILPMAVFIINAISFYLVGGLLWTLYYCIPLMILAYVASRNVFVIKNKEQKNLNLALLSFIKFNCMMFLVSSFGLNNLYLMFDVLLTLSFPTMLIFLQRSVKYDLR